LFKKGKWSIRKGFAKVESVSEKGAQKESDWECQERFWVWIGRRARKEIGKQRGGSMFSNL